MDQIELAIKTARECHTKMAWQEFYQKYGDLMASTSQSKIVTEVFRKLASDPQATLYSPGLWGALLQGSLSSWNIELGCEIARFINKLIVPVVAIPAAQVLLEGGHPAESREFAQRALRPVHLGIKEKLQLEMIVGSSFAEEGKIDRAVKILEKIAPFLRSSELEKIDRVRLLTRLGRLFYFIGRYADAAHAFNESAPIYLELKDWENAARALFNVGACYQNSGVESQAESYRVVEECRRLSIEHSLSGPLSHCESFYGFEAYHTGNFAGARDSFRRALAALPANDKSFRRLHVMSMLALTYFAAGKFALAKRVAKQTIDLAVFDESDRFKSRYKALEAELFWEDGRMMESLEMLREVTAPMQERGVHTLEDLSALSRYIVESAIFGISLNLENYKIDDQLKNNKNTYLEFEYASALMRCNSSSSDSAREMFQLCLDRSRELRSLNYEALSLLGYIRTLLRERKIDEAKTQICDLEIIVSRIGDTPIKASIQCLYAGIAYQEGDFQRAVKILTSVEKLTYLTYPELFSVQCCLATINGHSPRIQFSWQYDLVARFIRNHFAPTLSLPEPRVFVISGHYTVNLEKHPLLAQLLVYLIEKPGMVSSPAEIQTDVWCQSTNTQGWQQKIRNAIMRLRDLFPFTMAPIIIHDDVGVRFFASAIDICWLESTSVPVDVQARRILVSGPLSSQQIADRMQISLATAKRAIKKLAENDEIVPEKSGRNIVYRSKVPTPDASGRHIH